MTINGKIVIDPKTENMYWRSKKSFAFVAIEKTEFIGNLNDETIKEKVLKIITKYSSH